MLHQEFWVDDVNTASFVKADSATFLSKVVDELWIKDESDGHIVAR